MRYAGLKKYFILRLAQRPGALRDFLNLLGPDDDIARFEYLKKIGAQFRLDPDRHRDQGSRRISSG